MPRVLYNEGRVVGYSAYEIYVRHALTADPNTEPATESEWLASTLGLGSSMLLYVEPDNTVTPDANGMYYLEYELPQTSRLCGASTIIGSFFIGAGDGNTWSSKVTDYGDLISNTSTSSPTSSTIPTKTLTDITSSMSAQIRDFLKVQDAIVIQDGTWTSNASAPPEKTLSPDFTKRAKVRLQVKGLITTGFYLLLSGFTDSGVIYGVSDTTGTPQDPQNGDFIGPAAFPWSAKIILTAPVAALAYAGGASYTRAFPYDDDPITVDYAPIIDFDSADITLYYETHTDAAVTIDISSIETARPGIAVLATRSVFGTVDGKNCALPPDLIGGSTGAADEYAFGPLASYAPNSVHVFNGLLDDETGESPVRLAQLIESKCYGTTGLIREPENLILYEIDKVSDPENAAVVPVSDNRIVNENRLQIFNSIYMYFYRHHSGGGAPEPEDLASVSSFATQQQIYGYVSEKFLDEECLSYAEMDALFGSGGTATWMLDLGNLTMFNQLSADGDKYKYFLMTVSSHVDSYSGPTQQAFFVPVEKSTGRISIMISVANTVQTQAETGIGIDMTNKLDYLGSWWGSTVSQTDPKLGTWYALENHPLVRTGIPISDVYYRPTALTPKPPAGYGYQYLNWYKTAKVYGDLIPAADWSNYSIHDDFKDMSVFDFLKYAVNHYVGYPIGDSHADRANSSVLTFHRSIFGKSAINATAAGGYTEDDSVITYNVKLKAALKVKANISKSQIYEPAEIKFYEVTWDGDTATTSDDDSTSEYVDQFHTQWAAYGESGRHSTKTISLTDDIGNPLPLLGGAGTIESDYARWQDLMDALNNNKLIDILGILKELKKALSDPTLTAGTSYTIKLNSDGTISLVAAS